MPSTVSVIVPNYNHAPFLNERLESIFNQTYQDFEVLLLDDASTDTSLSILNTYKEHPKIAHVIFNKENCGSPFIQWKKGIALAKGRFVWIAESDDFASPDFLELTVPRLLHHENVALVYTDSRIVDESGTVKGVWSESKNSFFNTRRWNTNYSVPGKEEVLDYLLYRTTINNVSAVLFRKEMLLSNYYLEHVTGYKNAGDLFTFLFTSLQGTIEYLSNPLNNYRSHPTNLTAINKKSGVLNKERVLCFISILDLLFKEKPSKKEIKKIKKGYRYILYKNAFQLLKLGETELLNQLVRSAGRYKIFTFTEMRLFFFSFKLYKVKSKKARGFAKAIIKSLCKTGPKNQSDHLDI